MSYGYFDDEAKEYVVEKPDTPLPWINYIGCEEFFGLVSNTTGGYCFYKDARYRRLTRYRYNNVPFDTGGRYLYIKDGDSIWNPGWKPTKTELDSYECRHGMGYSKFKSEKDGLQAEVTFFVPMGGTTAEVWEFTITNNSNAAKEVSVFSFVEFCLWDAFLDGSNFQRTYGTADAEIHDNVIYHRTEYRDRRNHVAYFACGGNVVGFDSDRESFIGLHNGFHEPEVVLAGESKNSEASGWAPIGSHHVKLTLQPGESEKYNYTLGYAENPEDKKFDDKLQINLTNIKPAIEKQLDRGYTEKCFQELGVFWDGLLDRINVKTPDEDINRMVNIWNQYQCMVTFNLSRSASYFESGVSRGMGFRDSNQDALGFFHQLPEKSRKRILDLAATQFEDGSTFHQYQPLTGKGDASGGAGFGSKGFNDDPLWLVLSTIGYIKETGDWGVLETEVPFENDPEKIGSLYDHLHRSINYTLTRRGPHGLPLIGTADWNDCLNLNSFSTNPDEVFQISRTEEQRAESLMIAGLFLFVIDEMIEIAERLKQDTDATAFTVGRDEIRKAVEDHGWDGDWYIRAYDHHGNKIGSKECEEGKIYIESQGWLAMARVGEEKGYPTKALDAVNQHLDSEVGIVLQQPAYSKYNVELGEVGAYLPGNKENASVFAHNNVWIMISETMYGRGNDAFKHYKQICPSAKQDQLDRYRSEPYCYSQTIAGPDSPRFGEAKNSWLTGTAAWNLVTATQWILGVRPGFHGLIIDPCVPSDWKEFQVTRKFRGTTFNISFSNPDGVEKGIKEITVDGVPLEGQTLTADGDKTVDVQVTMG